MNIPNFPTMVVLLLAATRVDAAVPTLTVTQLTRDGHPTMSVSDVTLRGLNDHVLSQGLHTGEALPDDVRVEVPANETVTVTAQNGRSSLVLQSGAIATFHYTGSLESVAVAAGKASVDDPLNFFRVTAANGYETTPHG